MNSDNAFAALPIRDRHSALDDALRVARARYVEANSASAARHAEALRVMPGGNTRTVLHYAPFPLAFTRAESCYLWSADGRRYTDFVGEYSAGLYGHSHPVIIQTLIQTLESGISFGGHNMLEARLAALMCERFPTLALVRFTNSGTEANLMAVAAAAAVTGRRGVLVFDGAYHGSVLSFAGGGSAVNAPYDFVVGTYNDIATTRDLFTRHGPSLAAVLVEPMLGAGGCIPASADFLRLLRDEASRADALLIMDEVMTSRLAPGGLQALLGIRPDLSTLGKYLGGGMSFGAFGGRREIMERFDPTRLDSYPHAGTFNNNVMSMAAGIAGLSEIFTPEVVVALNRRGDELRDALNDLCRRRGVTMQVTGRGSLMTIHATDTPIHTPADVAKSDQLVKELLFFDLVEDGIWLARRGMIALTLSLGDRECEELIASVRRFIDRRLNLLEPGHPSVA